MDSLDEVRVVVSGATGKMGREIVRTILARADMHLVAALGHARHLGEDIGELVMGEPCGVLVTVTVVSPVTLKESSVFATGSTSSGGDTAVPEASVVRSAL